MAPNLHVGGVKMRERSKIYQPLRVINQNRTNDSRVYEDDEKCVKVNPKRKGTRKIIRAGSLVKNNINPSHKGRNIVPHQNEDFSNSFIEGKSFNSTNSKKTPMVEKVPGKELNQMINNEYEDGETTKTNVRDLERNSKILDFQNKIISSASIGPYPISNSFDPNVTMKTIAQANENLDKKLKQKQYVRELEEQIKLRDKIRREEESMKSNRLPSQEPMSADIKEVSQELQFEQVQIEPVSSPPKTVVESKDRRALGSAPKIAGSVIISEVSDPF
jgi:hypothetical protein